MRQPQHQREQQTWTPEHDEMLRNLWESAGLSASEIGRRMYEHFGVGRSRSAICGRVRRINLSRRCNSRVDAALYAVRSTRRKKGKSTARKSPVTKETIRHKDIQVAPPPIDPLHVSLELVQWGVCRAVSDTSVWGKPKYCGHACGETESFCAAHQAVFYDRAKAKKRIVSEELRHDRRRYRDSARWAGL